MARIAVLTNIPAPYRICVFNRLALSGQRVAICFLAPAETGRKWPVPFNEMRFEWRFLTDGDMLPAPLSEAKAAFAMLRFLAVYRPSAIICGGYNRLAAWVCFAWCAILRCRLILMLESTARDARKSGVVRTWLKRLFVSKADGIAPAGKASVDYVKALGAREEQIFPAPLSADNDFFAAEAAKVQPAQEKQRLGYPARLILYSGRLVREKGVFVLLEAFQRISAEAASVGLLVVGHGPAQDALEDFCRTAELEHVHFLGPRQYHEMPYFYALADVLALPTFSDTWGLVVNEAFACGVPAVVSRVAGACDDLIMDGETGYAVEPGNVEDLTTKILRILNDQSLRARMSRNCREVIKRFSPEACAEGLLAAASGHKQRTGCT